MMLPAGVTSWISRSPLSAMNRSPAALIVMPVGRSSNALGDEQVAGGVDRDACRQIELCLPRWSAVAAVQRILAPGAVTGDARDDARWADFSHLAIAGIGNIEVTGAIQGETTGHGEVCPRRWSPVSTHGWPAARYIVTGDDHVVRRPQQHKQT